jgi:hypothetical protein
MLHTCVGICDVTGILKTFCILAQTKQDLGMKNWSCFTYPTLANPSSCICQSKSNDDSQQMRSFEAACLDPKYFPKFHYTKKKDSPSHQNVGTCIKY